VFGYPKEARLRSPGLGAAKPVMIGDRCLIFNHVIIYEGIRIDDDVIEDRARIGYDSVVGSRARVSYGAYICGRVGMETGLRL
jgi:UDP-3-O-[3-hydroxymyristoyl] glucosamine N-acyltransferase